MKFNKKILTYVREKEYKKGIDYIKKTTKLYNTFKWFYILSFICVMVINLLFSLGLWVVMDDPSYSDAIKKLPLVIIFSLLMVAAFVLSKYNKNLITFSIFGALNMVSCPALAYIFYNLTAKNISVGTVQEVEKGIENLDFYVRHLIPLSVVLLSTVVMLIAVFYAYFKTKKSYNKVLENLYKEYNALPDDLKPGWEEYIELNLSF